MNEKEETFLNCFDDYLEQPSTSAGGCSLVRKRTHGRKFRNVVRTWEKVMACGGKRPRHPTRRFALLFYVCYHEPQNDNERQYFNAIQPTLKKVSSCNFLLSPPVIEIMANTLQSDTDTRNARRITGLVCYDTRKQIRNGHLHKPKLHMQRPPELIPGYFGEKKEYAFDQGGTLIGTLMYAWRFAMAFKKMLIDRGVWAQDNGMFKRPVVLGRLPTRQALPPAPWRPRPTYIPFVDKDKCHAMLLAMLKTEKTSSRPSKVMTWTWERKKKENDSIIH